VSSLSCLGCEIEGRPRPGAASPLRSSYPLSNTVLYLGICTHKLPAVDLGGLGAGLVFAASANVACGQTNRSHRFSLYFFFLFLRILPFRHPVRHDRSSTLVSSQFCQLTSKQTILVLVLCEFLSRRPGLMRSFRFTRFRSCSSPCQSPAQPNGDTGSDRQNKERKDQKGDMKKKKKKENMCLLRL
jgi:hypothetical protein